MSRGTEPQENVVAQRALDELRCIQDRLYARRKNLQQQMDRVECEEECVRESIAMWERVTNA